MRILFMTNVPSPYRVDFFNELGKKCDLTVVFEKIKSDERGTAWDNYQFKNFDGIFLHGKSINTDTAVCPEIIKYIRKGLFDHIICANFLSPTGMIAIEYMRLHKIPYFLESDGGFAKNGRGIKEKLKRHFISGAKGYFSTAAEHDQYYLQYGAKKELLYRYPFTSLFEKDILPNPVTDDEKIKLRIKLGLEEEKIVISVGQFIYRKGFDVLIRSAGRLNKNIGIYIIGGEPNDYYLNLKNEYKAENLHFIGFKSKYELAEYYKAADLFVFPTREDIWGLVVNEAMAYGLPVITTNRCISGLELVDSRNGFIINVNSEEELICSINKILFDKKENIKKMEERSLEKIRWYTLENMVKIHLKFLK